VTRARWTERAPETPRGPGWSGQPRRGNTARAGVGVAGRRPNRLRGLSVEGEVPQPDLWARDPSRQVQTDLIRLCQGQGERTRKGREGSLRPPDPPAPLISCRAGSARVRQTHWINRSTRCLISTLRLCSSQTCAICRSPLPRPFAPTKCGKRQKHAKRSRCWPRTPASLLPNWRNSRSRSASGRPRRRSTGIRRTRPSPGPAGDASRAGLLRMSMHARTRTSCSARRQAPKKFNSV